MTASRGPGKLYRESPPAPYETHPKVFLREQGSYKGEAKGWRALMRETGHGDGARVHTGQILH